jgi:group I intron endonuclease
MIIYKTTNLINGKFYIGKDKHNNPKYLGSGKILKLAIKKYGIKNFIKDIIEECDNEIYWLEREIYWIKYYDSVKSGYNIALGGNGGDTISNNPNRDLIGKRHSERMKDPLVNKNKAKGKTVKPRKKDDPNWIKKKPQRPSPLIGRTTSRKGIPNPSHSKWMKENNPMKGKTHTDEVKNILKAVNSKPKSEEHKRKISETLKGTKPGNMKQIIINNLSYESLSEAARQLMLPLSTVKNRLKSSSKKFKNWNYA